ncbi:hypothetical protein CGZ80_10935 [Rhodopirellula sp. MGV]|nr:hypothetical protein CGZ80_10935 [Rhodopirellula sp. MGV]PNY34983.1 hypothetical protein C2E31_20410 [Rhodopirellula baltica]
MSGKQIALLVVLSVLLVGALVNAQMTTSQHSPEPPSSGTTSVALVSRVQPEVKPRTSQPMSELLRSAPKELTRVNLDEVADIDLFRQAPPKEIPVESNVVVATENASESRPPVKVNAVYGTFDSASEEAFDGNKRRVLVNGTILTGGDELSPGLRVGAITVDHIQLTPASSP